MVEKFQLHAEVIISSKETALAVHRGVASGALRKLASRLYTGNLRDAPEAIIHRNAWRIIAGFYPGALIADRTALESRLAGDGSAFVVHKKTTELEVPGLRVRPRKGPGALKSDRDFVHGLRIASPARACLENLRPSRARGGAAARTLSREELVAHLDAVLRASGEDALNRLRDEARRIAPELGMEEEAQQFDVLVGALLGTRRAKLGSGLGVAYLDGAPYDVERMEVFEVLRQKLAVAQPTHLPAKATDGVALPFFEAYFSNYIEGTEFAVDEAEEIIFQGKVPAARPADAHDIIGTFEMVRSEELRRVASTAEGFMRILCERHARMMGGRPEMAPGVFKTEPNRAGETLFVHPRHVRGTLAEGFALCRTLATPFARALFTMFLVSEVHPFADGNGRAARVMMNGELVAASEARIIIPTVFRTEYLSSLKAITHNRRSEPLVSVLDFAWRYTHQLDFASLETARAQLTATNAFDPPANALGDGAKLVLPASLPR
jgi:fido (protein-threonine AMPylation protein)